MVGYEDRIAELANYVQNLQMKNYEEACTIKMIDEELTVCQGEIESKRQSVAADDTKSKKSSNPRKTLKPKASQQSEILSTLMNFKYPPLTEGFMPKSEGSNLAVD